MGNSESSTPDDTIIQLDFYFADNPGLGSDCVKMPLYQNVKHFKKLVQANYSFQISEYQVYQVQYDNKLHPDSDSFQKFWSTRDSKEVIFTRPAIPGS